MTDNQVTTRRIRDVVVVELPATFTSESEQQFNEKVEWALADTPAGVVLDFSQVKSIDGGGVGALDFLFMRTEEVDIPVVICCSDDPILAQLEEAGYLHAAQQAESVDEAVEMI
jgi:anti-anti-sigma factor